MISSRDLRAAELSRDFSAFVRAAWHLVEPGTPLVWAWYLQTLCDHLQAVSEGRILRLVINMPPRMGKSTLVSVLWPAWDWTRRPWLRWLTSSYGAELADRDALATRRVVESDWYQQRWGKRGFLYASDVELTRDQGAKGRYQTTALGGRITTSPASGATGEGGHVVTTDDPNNVVNADSEAVLASTNGWWDGAMPTRVSGTPALAAFVIVQQRTGENDLSGHVLEQGGYEHLCLPMRGAAMDADGHKLRTVLGEYDPREPGASGDLLDPVRWPEHVVAHLERVMGPFRASGQLQQRPSPAGGGIIKRAWIRFWTHEGQDVAPIRDAAGLEYVVQEKPDRFDEQLQSWDCSFKGVLQAVRGGKKPDPVAGHVWERTGPNCYLVDRVNRRMSVSETAAALIEMSARWPRAFTKLIEDKANGPAVMDILRLDLPGLIPVTPLAGKAARVRSAEASRAGTAQDKDARSISMEALFKAGNVLLPHPSLAPWVWAVVEQLCSFPLAAEDDDVDAASQALSELGYRVHAALLRDLEAPEPQETVVQLHNKQVHGLLWKHRQKLIEKDQRRSGRRSIPLV